MPSQTDAKIKWELVELLADGNVASFVLENRETGEKIYIKKTKNGVIDLSFDKPTEEICAMVYECMR